MKLIGEIKLRHFRTAELLDGGPGKERINELLKDGFEMQGGASVVDNYGLDLLFTFVKWIES